MAERRVRAKTLGMDLDARTLQTLDWPAVLARLSHHARTTLGAQLALRLPLPQQRPVVLALHRSVSELLALRGEGEDPPVGAVQDTSAAVEAAAQGRVLEAQDLIDIGRCLDAMERLRAWLLERQDRAPTLLAVADPIQVNPELRGRLIESFDEQGQLSEAVYPELGALRREIRGLHERVRSSLDAMLRSEAMAAVLQDRYVTQRGDRYVVPIKAEAKRAGLGIVHDVSNSGETVFVEPAEVVELNNRLRELEGQLRREEARILRALSSMVGRVAPEILDALGGTAEVDLVRARAVLGEELRGHLPLVGSDGVIALREARHPVLALRGVPVVPNDLRLDGVRPGLVLSGPNTGGKTVALKVLGLAALFTRAGIPFPAAEGLRVDLFPEVVADIGDLQTVEGDLSTFSGHLLVLREVLGRAAPGTLVLLDEVAVGTDPTQGAALARAVLERLVERGARAAVTTHYTDLKAFAAADPRFANAAVQLHDGKPTYRLRADAVGTSHAFSVARRMGLDEALMERAEALLSEESRKVSGLMQRLEEQRLHIESLSSELAERERRLVDQERELTERLARVRTQSQELVRREASASIERLRLAEEQARALVAALQRDPDLRLAGRTLEQLRGLRAVAATPEAAAAPVPRELQPGDRVRLSGLGQTGRVLSVPRKDQVEVEIQGKPTRVALRELVYLDSGGAVHPVAPAAPPTPKPTPTPAKAPVRGPVEAASSSDERLSGLRLPSNTLDLRGKRVDEALDELSAFVDGLVSRGYNHGFILHGHGTGALKKAIREHLPRAPQVAAWRPANEGEGGDAFTIVRV